MNRVLAAAACVVLAGCGSTVQGVGAPTGMTSQGSATGAAAGGSGLSLGTRSGQPGAAGAPNAGTPGHPATSLSPTSAAGAVIGSNGAAPGVPSAGRSGLGFTPTQIKIGVSVSSSANAAFATYGATGLSFPDGKQLANAYVAYLNRTGGIAGRKVVPVFYDYNAGGNVSTSDQSACATWTQDDHVAAALGVRAGATGSDDGLTPCLTKAGVPWMSGEGDAAKFGQYPQTLYAPALINSTRLGASVVNALYAAGFFKAGAKIGVVYQDDVEMKRAVDRGIAPALASHGLVLSQQAGVTNAFTQSANIELKFATAGITNVLFAAPGGAAAWQFMQNASQNHQHFSYGISSDDQPAIVLQQFAPHDQLVTTTGLGYAPEQDVSPSQASAPTKALSACLNVFRAAGFDTSSSTSRYAMSFVCDPFQLLRRGWAGQAVLSTPALADGINGLGTSMGVAGTFAANFFMGRHDGADAYRLLQYVTSCSCFVYHGPMRRTG